MTVLGDVQTTLYQRFMTGWADRTPYCFDNEGFDPPAAQWARLSVRALASSQETMGRKGNRKFARPALLTVQLFEPPGQGVSTLTDLGEAARALFEGCRFEPHDIRFNAVDVLTIGQVEGGRWWAVNVQGRLEYQDIR